MLTAVCRLTSSMTLCLLASSLSGQTRSEVVYRFKFGGVDQASVEGYVPVTRLYSSDHFMWISPVTNKMVPEAASPILQEYLTGPEGEFLVGLQSNDYTVTVTMSDGKSAHGPFAVLVQGKVVDAAVHLSAGEVLQRSYKAHVTDGRLRLRFQAGTGQTFVVNAMTIEGPPGARKTRLFPDAPSDVLPARDTMMRSPAADPKQVLRTYSDWLLAHRLPNGFIGDAEFNGQRSHDYWYTSSFPIRTMLASYEILGDEKYLDAATTLLDKLVSEQLPNGGFTQSYRGKPTSAMTQSEIDDIVHHQWINMADIGSIVMALGAAIHDVHGERAAMYTKALQHYCDDWAQQYQLPTGAFTNGVESGVVQTKPYSVATATEAGAFAVAYSVTHEERYRKTARRAADFLLDNWQPDGRPIAILHYTQRDGKPYAQPITQFGDTFYYNDGLLAAYGQINDSAFRLRVQKVLGWQIFGSQGLLKSIGSQSWFPLQDTWNNSKSAGMPLAFIAYERMHPTGQVRKTIAVLQAFLSQSDAARSIGVMQPEPDGPWGGHSLQSWAVCNMAATGFAGMSTAEIIRPGSVYRQTD